MLVSIRKSNGLRKYKIAQELQRTDDADRRKLSEAAKRIAVLDMETVPKQHVLGILDSCSEDPEERSRFKKIFEQSPKKLLGALQSKANDKESFFAATCSTVGSEYASEFLAYVIFIKEEPTPDEVCEVIEQLSPSLKKFLLDEFRKQWRDPSKNEEDMIAFVRQR